MCCVVLKRESWKGRVVLGWGGLGSYLWKLGSEAGGAALSLAWREKRSLQPGNRGSRQGPGAARCCQVLPGAARGCQFPASFPIGGTVVNAVALEFGWSVAVLQSPAVTCTSPVNAPVLFQWKLPASSLWR